MCAARAGEGIDCLLAEALAIRDEEVEASVSMGRLGSALMEDLVAESGAVTALTICNTGGLAAVERGTALGVIRTLHEQGRLALAIAVETRPLLQGSRLTAWELERMGAPYRIAVDAAGPALLWRGMADVVLTGADRIAANGDTANKIGTFSLAVAARYASVPFVVVAPESTVDMQTPSGEAIRIENRGADEVVTVRGTPIAPAGAGALNPAFDVTPAELITAIVTDRRIVRLDRGETLATVPLGERVLDAAGYRGPPASGVMKCTSAFGGTGSYVASGMMSPSMATAVAEVASRWERMPGNISSSLRRSSRTVVASTSICATPPVSRR